MFIQNFSSDKIFPMKENLFQAAVKLGKKLGFVLSTYGEHQLKCNQCDNPYKKKNHTPQPIKSRSKSKFCRCGCEFVLCKYVIPSFSVEGVEGLLKSPRDRLKYPERRDIQAVIISNASKFRHTNGCVPNYQQYIIGARISGTLFDKENQLMDHLLTVMELSPRHLDNHYLREKCVSWFFLLLREDRVDKRQWKSISCQHGPTNNYGMAKGRKHHFSVWNNHLCKSNIFLHSTLTLTLTPLF